jgi:ATP-dependent Clp protease ATP-binding subunit ClpX
MHWSNSIKNYLSWKALQLTIDEDVLEFYGEKAMEYKLGARGLRSICEGILTDAMYEMPSSKENAIHIGY